MLFKRLSLSLAITTLLFLSFAVVFSPSPVAAASSADCGDKSSKFLDFPTWYKYLNPTFQNGECQLIVDFPADLGKILLAVVEILLRVGGLVAVGFVIYGGFLYMLTSGEPEKAKQARGTIINALVGIGIAVSATAIVNLIGGSLL